MWGQVEARHLWPRTLQLHQQYAEKASLKSKSKSKRSISSRLLRYATFRSWLLSQISHNGASIQRKCRVLCRWSAAWSVSPVNNPHSHLQQKVGLIEPSSRAKNAKMFESWHYDFFPNFTGGSHTSQSIFTMASVVALNGISRHCLAQMHLACSQQCGSKIFQNPNHARWKEKVHMAKAGLFPVVGPCACFGAWGTSGIWQIIAWQPQPHPRIQLSKHWVLKEFSCQVSRLNPAMHVDVISVSQNQTPLRWIQYPFHRNGTNLIQICVSHPETFHIYILHSMRKAHWVHRFWNSQSPILLIAPGSEIKEHSAFPKPAA